MQTLHIALQDGFKNDTVVVTVNGKEVYRKSGVSTDLTISLADQFDVPVEEAAAKVEVNVSSRQATGSSEVRVQDTPNLAISLTREGKVTFQTSREMFRYM